MNTSSSADGISDHRVIVGTGVHESEIHVCDGATSAYAYADTWANANCYTYTHRDSDSGAQSYSYTKDAAESPAATIVHHWQ